MLSRMGRKTELTHLPPHPAVCPNPPLCYSPCSFPHHFHRIAQARSRKDRYMTLRVVPLGTNGYIPTLGRHTASYCCSHSSRPFSWTP